MLLRDIKPTELAIETIGNPNVRFGFSQFGEDSVICSLLQTHKRLREGFYVDVGAFDPYRYSNTALLATYYGWSGINIDANPESIERFNEVRPNDTNILAAVSDEEVDCEFAIFNHGAVNW